MSTREKGKIASASIDDDHGHHSVWLMLEFEGSGQGFGGIALGLPENGTALLDDYVASICKTFGVSELKRLVGKECYALRCFDINNEPIEASRDAVRRALYAHSVAEETFSRREGSARVAHRKFAVDRSVGGEAKTGGSPRSRKRAIAVRRVEITAMRKQAAEKRGR